MKLQRVLRATASIAKEKAIAPYSGFKVGAAAGGFEIRQSHRPIVITSGANIEVAASASGICAERVAISALLMQGIKPSFVCIDAGQYEITPCGLCLQFMQEWEPRIITPTDHFPFRDFLPKPYRGRRPKL